MAQDQGQEQEQVLQTIQTNWFHSLPNEIKELRSFFYLQTFILLTKYIMELALFLTNLLIAAMHISSSYAQVDQEVPGPN